MLDQAKNNNKCTVLFQKCAHIFKRQLHWTFQQQQGKLFQRSPHNLWRIDLKSFQMSWSVPSSTWRKPAHRQKRLIWTKTCWLSKSSDLHLDFGCVEKVNHWFAFSESLKWCDLRSIKSYLGIFCGRSDDKSRKLGRLAACLCPTGPLTWVCLCILNAVPCLT